MTDDAQSRPPGPPEPDTEANPRFPDFASYLDRSVKPKPITRIPTADDLFRPPED